MKISPVGSGLFDVDGAADVTTMLRLLDELRTAAQTLWASGTTAQRPASPELGQIYFDTTLARLIYCKAVRTPGVPASWDLV